MMGIALIYREKDLLLPSLDGYEVQHLEADNVDTLSILLREPPDLLIFASSEALELLSTLRSFAKLWHIPVLLLIADTQEVVMAIQQGVDALLPLEIAEALPTYVAQFALRSQRSALSPLTKLPGGTQIEQAIEAMLGQSAPWSLLYVDLDYFKGFNDTYGFLAGNELLRLTGLLCQRIVQQYGNPEDFVGHIGGDDFLIITTPDRAAELHMQLVAIYTQESKKLYRAEDLQRGSILGRDRKGRRCQFPLIGLSLSIISSTEQIDSIGTISALLTSAKRQIKERKTTL